MKKALRLLIPFMVTGLALWFVFKDVQLSELKESFGRAELFPAIVPFLGCFAIHFFFRSLRWRYLLPAEVHGKTPSLSQLFDSMMLGNLATFIFPFRLGEFVRPLILSRWTSYSFSTAFVSVVIERFFDLAAVLLSFAAIIPLFPQVDPAVMNGAIALATLAGGLLLFLICGCLLPDFTKSLVSVFTKLLPHKLAALIDNFTGDLIKGAAVVKTPSRLAAIIALTFVVWSFAWLQFYALLFIFPHEHSLLLSVALGVFVALAIAAPSAPGFFGAFQAGCVIAFSLFGYPVVDGKAYSLVVHLISYILTIAIGFILLRKHDLKLFDLKHAAEVREAAAES